MTEKPLPTGLNKALDEARTALHQHPLNALTPVRRLAIYNTFGDVSEEPFHKRLGWLGYLTAQKVLPIWEAQDNADELPAKTLDVIKALHDGTIKPEKNKLFRPAEDIHQWREEAGNLTKNPNLDLKRFFAAYSVEQAMWETLGTGPFGYEHDVDEDEFHPNEWLDETFSDINLDYTQGDTAGYAAWAVSDRVDDEDADLQKRLEFWEWWLTEAVPAAYRAVE